MLGLGDIWVFGAYILIIICALICVIYGALNWNRGAEDTDEENAQWINEEIELEKKI